MTNEEKSKLIALDKQSGKANGFLDTYLISYESAMEMAEWKEQETLKKVKNWLKEHAADYIEVDDWDSVTKTRRGRCEVFSLA